MIGAGEGNRTLLMSLGSSGNATIRRPLWARRLHSKRRRQPVQLFLLSRQPAIAPGMEEQRGDSGGFAEAFDTADEDGVVATGVGSLVGHFEGGAAAGEDRGAAGAGLPREAGKAVGRPGGEAIGEVFLLGRQDVDGVVAGFLEGRQVVRAVVQAPEDQRRVERDSREGIDGQADGVPVRIDGRDDGDTGGEAAKGVAQGTAVGLGLSHGWSG